MTQHPSLPTDRVGLPKRPGSSTGGRGARERLLAELPVRERQLRLNGIMTTVLEGGDGPPVLLLHGPGEFAAKWLHVVPDLVTSHRVVAPDLPGHGSSEPIDGPVTAARVLGWLEDLIEGTCATPPALVGQICGGAIAARLAADHGGRIEHLVLVDTLGLVPFRPRPDFGRALMAFMSDPSEDTHERLMSLCTFDLEALRRRLGEREEWINDYKLDRARAPELKLTQQGLMEQFGFPAIDPGDLARIAVPTTLVWGRQDLATPLSVAEEASRRYGWPLLVIEDAADDPAMEQPEAFLRAFRSVVGV